MASLFLLHILITLISTVIQSQTQNISQNSSSTPTPIKASETHADKSIWNSLESTEVPLFVLILALLIVMFCCCICCLCYINISKKQTMHRAPTDSHHEDSVSSNSQSNGKISLKSPKSYKSDFDVLHDMETEMGVTTGINIDKKFIQPKQISTIKQNSISSTMFGVDGHEIKSPQLPQHTYNSPSTVHIPKKSPSTIIIKHNARNRPHRRSSNRLQVSNSKKAVFDSPSLHLQTLPNNSATDMMASYDASLMALDGSVLRGTYESEGMDIINRLGTDSFSKVRTLKKNSDGAMKHAKGKSIIDTISGDLQSHMPDLAEDEFEVIGTPSMDPVMNTTQ